MEKLIQLSDHNNNRKISILITGLSVGTLALELAQRGIYEIDAPFGKYLNIFSILNCH